MKNIAQGITHLILQQECTKVEKQSVISYMRKLTVNLARPLENIKEAVERLKPHRRHSWPYQRLKRENETKGRDLYYKRDRPYP